MCRWGFVCTCFTSVLSRVLTCMKLSRFSCGCVTCMRAHTPNTMRQGSTVQRQVCSTFSAPVCVPRGTCAPQVARTPLAGPVPAVHSGVVVSPGGALVCTASSHVCHAHRVCAWLYSPAALSQWPGSLPHTALRAEASVLGHMHPFRGQWEPSGCRRLHSQAHCASTGGAC